MNFSFLSGGFLLIAIAAVWLFIFIPGMSERSEIRNRPSSVTGSKNRTQKLVFALHEPTLHASRTELVNQKSQRLFLLSPLKRL